MKEKWMWLEVRYGGRKAGNEKEEEGGRERLEWRGREGKQEKGGRWNWREGEGRR